MTEEQDRATDLPQRLRAASKVDDIEPCDAHPEDGPHIHIEAIIDKMGAMQSLLREAATELEAKGWRPIKTAPKDANGDAILLTNSVDYAVCTWYEPVEKWMFCETGNRFAFFTYATHWQPLPLPPEQEEKA